MSERGQRVNGDAALFVERCDERYVQAGRCHAFSLLLEIVKIQFRLLNEHVS
ncbi:hypothetical protein [Micromonospora sp. U21]|uniref:hypothetical protein n=1 Tax=Micromonospora sp. U21 TaxID=2824899 RepID=UPI001B3862E7|nr:hypothetical protein [Micromonospora sp. U21]MBQ0905324.1 hypothetical protein [Micromonospora sp. U21]